MSVSADAITVTPHRAESILGTIILIIAALLWVLIVISVVGIVYGLFFGAIFLVAQITLIAHVRGNTVKLGPNQMPELYNRVAKLSQRIGLSHVPDAYVMQSGGVLNAFATRFGSRNFVVLYSEMVKACEGNDDALDFIIGHELGHLHRGHLRWRWFKAPAKIIPFLGSAYSRACEYTSDRYGKFSCSDPKRVHDSLCLLACGAHFAPVINPQEFVAQEKDLNSVFMKLGTWMQTHPPLAKRVVAISPELRVGKPASEALSTIGAILIGFLVVIAPAALIGWVIVDAIHSAAGGMMGLMLGGHEADGMNPSDMPDPDSMGAPDSQSDMPQDQLPDDVPAKPPKDSKAPQDHE